MIEPSNGSPDGSTVHVAIGGKAYTLRYSALAEYVADDLGVDVSQFIRAVKNESAGRFSTIIKLFSAMVAHNFPLHQAPLPEYWVEAIEGEKDPEAVSQSIGRAVMACLVAKMRASVEKLKLQEPAPKPQAELQ